MESMSESSLLVSQCELERVQFSWRNAAYEDIKTKLSDVNFPCIFSKRAFRKKIIKFIFLENNSDESFLYLCDALKQYVLLSEGWDGDLDKAHPLLIVFSHDCIKANTVEKYHSYGWEVLQKIHEMDNFEWPSNVANDPDDKLWSMCFNGMPLFCNMSTPLNVLRQSRNLGAYFTMVVNPRERFDLVAGDNDMGKKVREVIRNRINSYDITPHSPLLGTYGTDSLEWPQYSLLEENLEEKRSCPFKFIK